MDIVIGTPLYFNGNYSIYLMETTNGSTITGFSLSNPCILKSYTLINNSVKFNRKPSESYVLDNIPSSSYNPFQSIIVTGETYYILVSDILNGINYGTDTIYDVDLINSGLSLSLKYISFNDGNVINALNNTDVSELDFGIIPHVTYIKQGDPQFIKKEFNRRLKFKDIYMYHTKYIYPDIPIDIYIPLWLNFTIYDESLLGDLLHLIYKFRFYSFARITWEGTTKYTTVRSIRRTGYMIVNLANVTDFRDALCIRIKYNNWDIINALKVDDYIVALIYYEGTLDELITKLQANEFTFVVYDNQNQISYTVPPSDIMISQTDDNKFSVKFEIATAITSLGIDKNSIELHII